MPPWTISPNSPERRMCRIGTPPSNATALAGDKKPRRGGVLCQDRMRSGRNGFFLLDALSRGGRPRWCGGLVLPLQIVGQFRPARFLGFARLSVHLVELVTHKNSFRIKRRAGLPCHALELSIDATLRAAEIQREESPNRPNGQPVLPLRGNRCPSPRHENESDRRPPARRACCRRAFFGRRAPAAAGPFDGLRAGLSFEDDPPGRGHLARRDHRLPRAHVRRWPGGAARPAG